MNNVPENSSLLKFLEQNYSVENLDSSVLNDIDALVFLLDVEEMRPVWFNDFFYKRLHYTSHDLKTITKERFLGSFHEKSLANFKHRMASIDSQELQGTRSLYQIRTGTGDWIYLLICSRSYKRNKDGSLKLILGFGTEVRKSELDRHMSRIRELEGSPAENSLRTRLSSREMDVVRLITRGLTDKEIAGQLNISIHTTKTHRKRIISKLGLKNTAALVKFAVENDLD